MRRVLQKQNLSYYVRQRPLSWKLARKRNQVQFTYLVFIQSYELFHPGSSAATGTVPKWAKSKWQGQDLVRLHRFCPLITMVGFSCLPCRPSRWSSWIYQPPDFLRRFLVTSRFVVIIFSQKMREIWISKGGLRKNLKFRAISQDVNQNKSTRAEILYGLNEVLQGNRGLLDTSRHFHRNQEIKTVGTNK